MNNAGDIVKKSIKIGDHSTSVTLEQAFWETLAKIAKTENTSVRALVMQIDEDNAGICNLSSAIRVFILKSL